MLQTTALASQNEGTLFNIDFARGYASHGLGAICHLVKKGTIKKITTLSIDTGNFFVPLHVMSTCQMEQRCFAQW